MFLTMLLLLGVKTVAFYCIKFPVNLLVTAHSYWGLEVIVSEWIHWINTVDVKCVLVQEPDLKRWTLRGFFPGKGESERTHIEGNVI